MTSCFSCFSEVVSNHSSTVSFTTAVASAKALKCEGSLRQESRKPLCHVGSGPGPHTSQTGGLYADTMETQGPGVRQWGALFCLLLTPPPPFLARTQFQCLRTQHCNPSGYKSLQVVRRTWSLQRHEDSLRPTFLFKG